MAKKQTRRSISIHGQFYAELRAWLREHKPGMSLSNFIEDLAYAATGIPRTNRQQADEFRDTKRLLMRFKKPEEPELAKPTKPPIHRMDPKLVAALLAQQSKPMPIVNPCRASKCKRIELHEAHD